MAVRPWDMLSDFKNTWPQLKEYRIDGWQMWNIDVSFVFQTGESKGVSVEVGDKVLLPEYGGTKINLEEKV